MRPVPDLAVTVIAREAATPYTGMLPGYVAGHYTYDECHIDLYRLCRAARARLYADEATGLDVDQQRVHFRDRPPVSYDVLSLDIGSTPDQTRVPGAAEHTLSVKPVGRFIRGLNEIEGRILRDHGGFRIAVVGGGAGGTELCLALHHRFAKVLAAAADNPARISFCLVAESGELMPSHNRRARSALTHAIRERGIEMRLGCFVERVSEGCLHVANGPPIRFDAVCWATSAKPADWLRSTGLALDVRGFVRVNWQLRSVSHPNVFAAGDVAAFDGLALEKSGVYAVRQGPVLSHNLMALCRGAALKAYRPQRKALALVSTGNRYAVASKWSLSVQGRWIWSLKDRIDRRWMRKYQQVNPMPTSVARADDVSAAQMPCGGCGAKVGSASLHRVLSELSIPAKPDILIGLREPDDAAVFNVPERALLVQSVDYFRPFIDDPYRFARIAANHCLGDLYAMGATPHSALAIITLPHGPERLAESDLRLLMRGCTEALDRAGAALIGGHTGRGEELGFGLAVNGFAQFEQLLRKNALLPGEALILTKPLGTGALFAGHMRGLAKAAWIDAALRVMEQSNKSAIDVFRRCGAAGCTDITGFGLVGHLLEMLRASGADATLNPSSLPALEGARELLAQGIESSLAPENRKLGPTLRNFSTAAPAEIGLLFDPQTAGGLLAGIPADRAQQCVAALHEAGLGFARCIGTVTPRAGERETVSLLN